MKKTPRLSNGATFTPSQRPAPRRELQSADPVADWHELDTLLGVTREQETANVMRSALEQSKMAGTLSAALKSVKIVPPVRDLQGEKK